MNDNNHMIIIRTTSLYIYINNITNKFMIDFHKLNKNMTCKKFTFINLGYNNNNNITNKVFIKSLIKLLSQKVPHIYIYIIIIYNNNNIIKKIIKLINEFNRFNNIFYISKLIVKIPSKKDHDDEQNLYGLLTTNIKKILYNKLLYLFIKNIII